MVYPISCFLDLRADQQRVSGGSTCNAPHRYSTGCKPPGQADRCPPPIYTFQLRVRPAIFFLPAPITICDWFAPSRLSAFVLLSIPPPHYYTLSYNLCIFHSRVELGMPGSRFTVLAALCSIATVSLVPTPVDAAAINLRTPAESGSISHSSSFVQTRSDSAAASPSAHHATQGSTAKSVPVIPLPQPVSDGSDSDDGDKKSVKGKGKEKNTGDNSGSSSGSGKGKSKGKGNSQDDDGDDEGGDDDSKSAKKEKKGKDKDRRWDPFGPLLQVGDFRIGDKRSPAPSVPQHQHDSRFHFEPLRDLLRIGRNRDGPHSRPLVQVGAHNGRRDPHHGHRPEVIVKGNDDHVHYRREVEAREPIHGRRHHRPDPRDPELDAREPHHRHPKIIVTGDHDDVHVRRSPEPHHGHHRHHHHDKRETDIEAREPHRHHGHHHHHDKREADVEAREPHSRHHAKIIISGDHDDVKLHHRAPEPEPHHGHGKIVVSGDNDHVHVPRHHHHDHYGHGEVIVSGNDDHVHVGRSILIAGEQGQAYVVAHGRARSEPQKGFRVGGNLWKRDSSMQSQGVPGRIDIVSPVINKSEGERIASLVLAPADATSITASATNSTSSSPADGAPFVLNASQNNQTQIYLVPVPPSDSSSAPDFLAASSNSSSPLSPNEMLVTLQLPVFDPKSATIVPFCATFDPNPPKPAPLTAQACEGSGMSSGGNSTAPAVASGLNMTSVDNSSGGDSTTYGGGNLGTYDSGANSTDSASNSTAPADTKHTSQFFAYNKLTGVVRPMWFNGMDDGTDDGSSGQGGTDSVFDEPEDGSMGDSGEAPDEGVAAVDPPTPQSAVMASVTDVQSADSEPDATPAEINAAPPSPSESGDSSKYATPQNVSLVFMPAAPELGVVPFAMPDAATTTADVTYTSTYTSTSTATQSITMTLTPTPASSATDSYSLTTSTSSTPFTDAAYSSAISSTASGYPSQSLSSTSQFADAAYPSAASSTTKSGYPSQSLSATTQLGDAAYSSSISSTTTSGYPSQSLSATSQFADAAYFSAFSSTMTSGYPSQSDSTTTQLADAAYSSATSSSTSSGSPSQTVSATPSSPAYGYNAGYGSANGYDSYSYTYDYTYSYTYGPGGSSDTASSSATSTPALAFGVAATSDSTTATATPSSDSTFSALPSSSQTQSTASTTSSDDGSLGTLDVQVVAPHIAATAASSDPAVSAASSSSSAEAPGMTPVSTAPYEWMFMPDGKDAQVQSGGAPVLP
ncbi:hypothetical protein EVG20_g5756 [Dentipellis fragilis]|uniref:Uncharacterized protein n=1 Tax=Dentipellis fragilis TaxID=205917 RepID=A0A4Y9YQW6_9AGAM|nr:hypothetical protein EVG20_g5756 [Dentipellis fragilis]